MTLTDEQVRALMDCGERANAARRAYGQHEPMDAEDARLMRAMDIADAEWGDNADPTTVIALATEVLAQRERKCGTCAHWRCGDGGDGFCLPLTQFTACDWFCADWRAKETP